MNNAVLKVLKPDPPYLYLIRQAINQAAATGMSESEILEMTRRLIRDNDDGKNGGKINDC